MALVGCDEEIQPTLLSDVAESPYVLEVNKSLKSQKPLAIGFFADWCPHCSQYKPIFKDVEEIIGDEVTFIGIDIDDIDAKGIVDKFMVKGVPTTAFISSDGAIYDVQSGGISKERLIALIEELRK